MRTLVICIGPSGSGKSTWAEDQHRRIGSICSADNHFMVDGEYRFDLSRLPAAHRECRYKVLKLIQSADPPDKVYVDNTNCSAWELAFYVELASTFAWEVELHVFDVPWQTCAERTQHGTPEHAIRSQYRRMQQMLDHMPPWYPKPVYHHG